MKTPNLARWLAVGAVILGALAGVACREITINRLLAEPGRYADEEVGLKGEVVDSVSVLGRGAYKLDDGTGTIWIVSDKGVPRRGARVGVRGKIKDVVDLGTLIPLPPQVGSGMVMVESEHKAKY
jgi:hypothetical protein